MDWVKIWKSGLIDNWPSSLQELLSELMNAFCNKRVTLRENCTLSTIRLGPASQRPVWASWSCWWWCPQDVSKMTPRWQRMTPLALILFKQLCVTFVTSIALMSWVNIQKVVSRQKMDFKGKMFFCFQRQDEALFNFFIGQNMSQINKKIQI